MKLTSLFVNLFLKKYPKKVVILSHKTAVNEKEDFNY